MRFNSFGRRYLSHGKQLQQARITYPYRLIRAHSNEPRPESINVNVFGDFVRFPSKSGDEWLFASADARARFIAEYGGTALGE